MRHELWLSDWVKLNRTKIVYLIPGYVVIPDGNVGLAEDENDFDFNERFAQLKAGFEAQLKEEGSLNDLIQTLYHVLAEIKKK